MTIAHVPILSAATITGAHPPSVPVDGGGPFALAKGLDAYVEECRALQKAGMSLGETRLKADMEAQRFAHPRAGELQISNSFIVLNGQEIAIKIFHPGTEMKRPAICYFHGGGFMMGSIETFAGVAAGLAAETGAVVVSVEYRRLPQNSYDDAQDDCYAAYLWLREHVSMLNVDPERIAIAGDSVGALFATVTAAMLRDREHLTPACQLLLYGAYALDADRAAVAASKDPLLTPDRVASFVSAYHTHRRTAEYGPPLSSDNLADLPPAVIVGAELDPLLGEGEAYAARLKDADIEVRTETIGGMIHGFLRAATHSEAVAASFGDIAGWVRPYLWPATKGQEEASHG